MFLLLIQIPVICFNRVIPCSVTLSAIRTISTQHRIKVQRSLPQHVSTSITLSTFIREVSNSKLVWATPWSKTSPFFIQALHLHDIKCRKIMGLGPR